jgi:KUP system potassium uptake protein
VGPTPDGAARFLLLVETGIDQGHGADHGEWRKRLFIATSMFSTDASVYFGLPPDRTVIMGERIEV